MDVLSLPDMVAREGQAFHSGVTAAALKMCIRDSIKEDEVFSAIDFRKDVDGFHPVNVGKLLLGQNPLFKPCLLYTSRCV